MIKNSKTLYRVFFYIKIILPFILSLGYLWSVQSPLESSFNNQLVYWIISYFFIAFFSIKIRGIEKISLILFLIYIFLLFLNFFLNDGYLSDVLIFFLFSLNAFIFFNISFGVDDCFKKTIAEFFFFSTIFASFLSSFIVVYQWLGMANSQETTNLWVYPAVSSRLSANLAQPNNLATLLCMGVASIFYFREKFLYKPYFYFIFISSLILLSFCIFLTGSRTAYIALFFVGFYLLHNRLKVITSFLPIIFLFFYWWSYDYWQIFSGLEFPILTSRGSESGRYLIWEITFDLIKQSPWLGYGPGNSIKNFSTAIPSYPSYSEGAALSSAHNIFLDIALWMGVPFSFFILLLYFFISARGLNTEKNSIQFYCFLFIIPMMIHSLLEYPQNYLYFLIPFFSMLGIAISSPEKKTPSNTRERSAFFFLFLALGFLSFFFIKEYYSTELMYKKIRLQKLGVDIPTPYTGKEKCYLDSYCDFLKINFDKNLLDEKTIIRVSERFPTPLTMEKAIKISIEKEDVEKSNNLIISYCLIFDIIFCARMNNFIGDEDSILYRKISEIRSRRVK